ncbi:hypothetical protein [Actinacidiphila acidipaludis]|uniref:Uncharacterized protein n=1 Tax=Actinacidiphila acidipaludis TaxID=2873382 RepID=A0ABS7Q2S2_9ACTN|nr:hypothetical protein [Streptomyces acidipaludis]MBY8877248.1 hypothetical protein [Streptomyces acidipaludis]
MRPAFPAGRQAVHAPGAGADPTSTAHVVRGAHVVPGVPVGHAVQTLPFGNGTAGANDTADHRRQFT